MGRFLLGCIAASILFSNPSISTQPGYCQQMEEACSKPVIIDVYAGEPVSLETMLDEVATAKIVYLGELHSIKSHHEFQTLVIRGLYERGCDLSLGMEMFGADQQEILNGWLASNKNVSDLGDQLGKEKWTNLPDYDSLLNFARDHGIKVIGLNASNDVVKKIARGQIMDLTPEQQKGLPDAGLLEPNPIYDRLLRLKLRVHKAFEGKSLDGVVRAQLVRDGVMAATIVRHVKSMRDKDSTMVVIAGSGHLNYGFGIPEIVKKKMQVKDRIILPTESGQLILSDEERRQAVPLEITHEDLRFIREPIADYLYVFPIIASDANGNTNKTTVKTVR